MLQKRQYWVYFTIHPSLVVLLTYVCVWCAHARARVPVMHACMHGRADMEVDLLCTDQRAERA